MVEEPCRPAVSQYEILGTQLAGLRSGQTYSCTHVLLVPTYLSLLRIQISESVQTSEEREAPSQSQRRPGACRAHVDSLQR